jgi:hypothetical protein
MVVGGVALLPLPPAGAVGLAVGREAGQPGERGVWLRDIVPPSFGSIPSAQQKEQPSRPRMALHTSLKTRRE